MKNRQNVATNNRILISVGLWLLADRFYGIYCRPRTLLLQSSSQIKFKYTIQWISSTYLEIIAKCRSLSTFSLQIQFEMTEQKFSLNFKICPKWRKGMVEWMEGTHSDFQLFLSLTQFLPLIYQVKKKLYHRY